MNQTQGVAVTYKGRDDPFIDRIYRSGLTFAPGQTRTVPPTLAQRLLRHADVFERVKSADELAAEAAAAKAAAEQAAADAAELTRKQAEEKAEAERLAAEQAKAAAERKAHEAAAQAQAAQEAANLAAQREQDAAAANAEAPKDDTADLLAEAQKQEDKQREQEDARSALMDQLDSMDKKALIDWAAANFKQAIHPNTGEAKVRETVKGFVDQYGVP